MADTVSPPPAIENAFDCAIANESSFVPCSNKEFSKTPRGPFHNMVFEVLIICNISSLRSWSNIISSFCTSLIFFLTTSLPSKVREVTTFCGRIILPPSNSSLAIPSMDSSNKDIPTSNPAALMNVLAIPPPTTIWSALVLIFFISSSFVDTFEPPMTAVYGPSYSFKALVKEAISFWSKIPAHASFE